MSNKITGLPPIAAGTELNVGSGRKAALARPETVAEPDRSSTDRVELTGTAQVLGGGAEAPVDAPRVEALRRQIADGHYRIDADRIAGRLLELERPSRKD